MVNKKLSSKLLSKQLAYNTIHWQPTRRKFGCQEHFLALITITIPVQSENVVADRKVGAVCF
jgi:hypothetical protein